MGILTDLIGRGENGKKEDVDFLMGQLTSDSSIAMTRFVDYALSFVRNPEGVERMEYYLFNGTLMQRNYCTLYFNRKGDWETVRRAFKRGLIDEIQAFSR